MANAGRDTNGKYTEYLTAGTEVMPSRFSILHHHGRDELVGWQACKRIPNPLRCAKLTTTQVVFGKVLEGMDIVNAIGNVIIPLTTLDINGLTDSAEDVAKGRNDRPDVDVVIADCGEVRIVLHKSCT